MRAFLKLWFNKFLAFWKDADPDIAGVADPMKRGAGLKELP